MKNKEENFKKLKEKIIVSNLLEEEKMKEKTKITHIIKPMIAASVMLVSLSGIVFAKEISNKIYNKYFTGTGVEKAINEGYVENTKMEEHNSDATVENEETGQIIEDNETSIKVSELIMDDFTLSMTFEVTLSDQTKEIITANEVMEMNFPDIVVYDENNIVLNTVNENEIDKFKEKTNLEPKDFVNSGVNTFVSERNNNTIKLIYNFYTGGDSVYPKSKELNIFIDRIKVSKNETVMGNEEITIRGNWNFKVDVPEKMYNRKNIVYTQKSTTNKDFNAQSAVLYNTGMEIGMKFKAEKKKSLKDIESRLSEELEFFWSLDKDDKLNTIDIANYLENKVRENPEYQKQMEQEMSKWEYEKYLTNSKGERFDFTVGPRENGGASIDDNGIMTSTCMFDLTTYDATDEITLHIDYKGNKADIILERKD